MKYKKLNEHAKVPTRADNGAAGYDLYATNTDTITINPHQTVMVGTGLAMAIPIGLFGAIFARSGLASKRSLRPANAVGIIDESYRGEVIVPLHNDSNEPQYVEPGERVAQLVLLQYFLVDWDEVGELSETERGTGGFGSSGTK